MTTAISFRTCFQECSAYINAAKNTNYQQQHDARKGRRGGGLSDRSFNFLD
jgi:hypothetical protein